MDNLPVGDLGRDALPMQGKGVVVTGVSRRGGIGYATACRLAAFGANVFCHHYSPHDHEQPWGGDDVSAVVGGVGRHLVDGAKVADLQADLADLTTPDQVMDVARAELGQIDALVCNQALSVSDGALGQLTGYLTADTWPQLAPRFPFGRFGQPDDAARLIAWLCTEEAPWITGQTINSEGGFRRWG